MKFKCIYVEITNICNLRCSFCSKTKREYHEMSIEEFLTVIKKIKPYADSIYLHIKGEPLLHSNFAKILEICNDNNINVRITTNGTYLQKHISDLLKYNVKQINISLHCENNDNNYFNKVFSATQELSQKITIIYRIWTLSDLKINEESIKIVDKLIDYYKLSTNIVNKIMEDKNIKLKNNVYLDKDCKFIWPNVSYDTNESSNEGYCLGTKTHIGILSNGVVVPCCLDSEGIVNLGNIFNDSLESIINNKQFQEIRNGFNNNKVINPLCQKCCYRTRFNK